MTERTLAVQWDTTIAANIRAERARIGIDQETLVKRMRALGYDTWHRQTVGKVERGERRVLADELPGLARCLGCHLIGPWPHGGGR